MARYISVNKGLGLLKNLNVERKDRNNNIEALINAEKEGIKYNL